MRITKDMTWSGMFWLFVAGLPTDLRQWRNPWLVRASDSVALPHQFLAVALIRAACLAIAILVIPAMVLLGRPWEFCLALAAIFIAIFFILSYDRYYGL